MRFILASQSPRRRELLASMGLTFDIIVPNVCEDLIDGLTPAEFAAELSRRKLDAVLKGLPKHPNETDVLGKRSNTEMCELLPCSLRQNERNEVVVTIAADTIVTIDGQILGKPTDETDAFEMLKILSGRRHSVITGLSVAIGAKVVTDFCETLVKFKDLTDGEIREYIKTGEPFDKAGAYGIQGAARDFVEMFDGSFDNVVGLPTEMLREILSDVALF